MAPQPAKAAAKPASAPAAKKASPVKKPASAPAKKASTTSPKKVVKGKASKPRNYEIADGVYRFSRSKMYHKKALWKFVGKKTPKTVKPQKPLTVEKAIGGAMNGEKRLVLLKKRRNYYPTQDKVKKHPAKKCFNRHERRLRSTLTPGTVGILLAGPHKGKRVVILKQLKSGLLLVTGPFLINACPLRRINQIYVIGTRTKIDLSDVKLPSYLNDTYFKREKKKRAKKEEGDIFTTKKESYKPSEKRKVDQKQIDKQIIAAIKKHPDRKLLMTYLASMFGLRSSQFPHRLQF